MALLLLAQYHQHQHVNIDFCSPRSFTSNNRKRAAEVAYSATFLGHLLYADHAFTLITLSIYVCVSVVRAKAHEYTEQKRTNIPRRLVVLQIPSPLIGLRGQWEEDTMRCN